LSSSEMHEEHNQTITITKPTLLVRFANAMASSIHRCRALHANHRQQHSNETCIIGAWMTRRMGGKE
jgi:hypothetical protein